MVILLPTMSWICTILATLKFQEILLPEPPIIPSLPPSKPYYIAPSQTPIQYNLGMLLLPPWQQSVVNLGCKYQNTTKKKVLDSDSNSGSSVDILESIAKDTEMIDYDDVGNSENEAKPNDDIIEEDNIVDQEDEDEVDIINSSEKVNDNNGLEENADEEAETNQYQIDNSIEIKEISDESPIDFTDETEQDMLAKKEEVHALSQLLDIGDTTYTEPKDDEHSFSEILPETDNELQMEIDDGEQDREADSSIFELQLDEYANVFDQNTPLSNEYEDVKKDLMPLTIEEVNTDVIDMKDQQYPDKPLTIDDEDHEIEVRSIQEDDTSSFTPDTESEEVAIHIDEETEDDDIEEVMRDDETSQLIHEHVSDRNKSVNAAVLAAVIEEILKNGGDVMSPSDYHTPHQIEITLRSIESIRVVTANIATVFIILSVVYSVAVHIFLSSFHERPYFMCKHWSPVGFRALAALIITLEIYLQDFMLTEDNNVMIGMGILFNIMTIFGSMFLIYQTRCQEIDGPTPMNISVEGKVVFITGGNSGIGLETARQLYQRGATILLGCRSEARAMEAIHSIDPNYTDESSEKGKLHYINIDLTSIASIHQAVQTFDKMNMPLHTLILNAGVMRNKREETVDALEMTMAANHLGHFLLANLLLPKLRATAQKERSPSRVITVSSSLYHNARRTREDEDMGSVLIEQGIDLSDLQCQSKEYSLFDQYAQSKLANILFALELGRREKKREQYQTVVTNANGESQVKESPVLKRRKKIRPKLTPSTAEEQEHDEDDELGFSDVVSTPIKKKKVRKKLVPISTSEEKKDEDTTTVPSITTKKKKKLRPKLTPISPVDVQDEDDSDGDDLLGFGEYMPTPPSRSIKKVISSDSNETTALQTLPYPQDKEDTQIVNENNGLCLVKSICLHPGLVRTNVVRDMPWYLYYPNKAFSLFMMMLQKSPQSGAYTSVYCALMDAEVPDECYYVNSEPQQLAKHALDEEDAKQLWDLSSELVMLEEKSTS